MEREVKYCIIKEMLYNDKTISVIVLDTHGEVLEYDGRDEANHMADIMETNSDSGWRYIVKDI